MLELAALTHHPEAGLELIARCKQACLQEAREIPMPSSGGARIDSASDFIARLLSEENRLAMGAKLSWVEEVGRELKAIANATSPAAAPGSRSSASASATTTDHTSAPRLVRYR